MKTLSVIRGFRVSKFVGVNRFVMIIGITKIIRVIGVINIINPNKPKVLRLTGPHNEVIVVHSIEFVKVSFISCPNVNIVC